MGNRAASKHHQHFRAHTGDRSASRSTTHRHHTSQRQSRRLRAQFGFSSHLVLMQRHVYQPRIDWRKKVEAVGLTYHSHDDGPYWDESACYELTADEVNALETAANKLHYLCIEAAEAVIENE